MPAPRRSLALAGLLALGATGCVLIDAEAGRPVPSASALAALEPGRTMRAEVIARLGPPEEYRGPVPGARLRAFDPATVRVVTERDVIGRRMLTWVREVRRDRRFIIPLLFTYRRQEQLVDRVLVTLDEHDRVEHVAARREIDPPEGGP